MIWEIVNVKDCFEVEVLQTDVLNCPIKVNIIHPVFGKCEFHQSKKGKLVSLYPEQNYGLILQGEIEK